MRSRRQLRRDAARIWSAALRAVDPARAVRARLARRGSVLRAGGRSHELAGRRVWVLAIGKAAAPMAAAVEGVLGKHLTGGLAVTKDGHALPLRRLEVLQTGHPLPDARGLEAARRIRRFVQEEIGPDDLVLALLSGGASALTVAPAEGLTLDDKLATTELLLRAGASIHELNAVRKHLSWLKGGGLARLLASNTVVALVLSDVAGDDLATIASGPLVADPTTYADCAAIARRLGVEASLPRAVRARLEAGARGSVAETPKAGDRAFERKHAVLVGSNAIACTAAAAAAKRLGYRSAVLTSTLEGNTAEAAGFHASIAREIAEHGRPLRRPACVVSGGETTVRVRGRGKGGRNQEFVLHCAPVLARMAAPCVVASLGTDGTDGPTDAAGAIADNRTEARAREHGERFLEEALADNDSYHFFERLGDLIVTGPTRTNVMDLRIVLVG